MQKVRPARAAVLLAIVIAFPGVAPALASQELPAPGVLTTTRHLEFVTAPGIQERAAGLFKEYPLPELPYGVDIYHVTFVSRDYDGSLAPITALLYVPRLADAQGLPLLVFGAGTTGVGDACAPSLEQAEGRHFGDYRENMLAYAAMGMIVILPDYLGFNDATRPQRYFSHDAEGHVMLDAARAVDEYFRRADDMAHPMGKVFMAGYSQGGHAAFSAADLWQSYAPEVPFAGVIGLGATTDVEALLREGPAYAPLIFYTYSVMYGSEDVDPTLYLQPQFAATLAQDVTSLCIDQFQAYYSYDATKVYQKKFWDVLRSHGLWLRYPRLSHHLQDNQAGLSGHGLPALVVEGHNDFIVTPTTQKKFVDGLRFRGSTVSYIDMAGVRHMNVREAGFRISVEWIKAVARGETPPED